MGNQDDDPASMVLSPDGSTVFVTGRSAGDIYTIATVAYRVSDGWTLWKSRYPGEWAGDIAISPDGMTVFVTGTSSGAYATVAYQASDGKQLWAKRYNGPGNGSDDASSVSVSRDGTMAFVTGRSDGGASTGADFATVAYQADSGKQLWIARYNGPASGDDGAAAVISPGGGKVYVTGSSDGGASAGPDYATIAYQANSGRPLWIARYNGTGNEDDWATSVAASPDRTALYVTGSSRGSTTLDDYATVAYRTSDGARLWVVRYNGTRNRNDQAHSVSVSQDGTKVFVTGRSRGLGSGDDFLTVAYTASRGAELWARRYNGVGTSYDAAYQVVSPGGGRVIVTGASWGGTGTMQDYMTIAYTATLGNVLWMARWNGPADGSDYASSLVVTPDRARVIVFGRAYSGPATGFDYATVAYQG